MSQPIERFANGIVSAALFTSELIHPGSVQAAKAPLKPLAISSEFHEPPEMLEMKRQLQIPSRPFANKLANLSLVDITAVGNRTVALGYDSQSGNYHFITTIGGTDKPLLKDTGILTTSTTHAGKSVVTASENPDVIAISGNVLTAIYPGVLTYTKTESNQTTTVRFAQLVGEVTVDSQGNKAAVLFLTHRTDREHRMYHYDLKKGENREVPITGLPTNEMLVTHTPLEDGPNGTTINTGLTFYGYADLVHSNDRVEATYYPTVSGLDTYIERIPGANHQPSTLLRSQWVTTPSPQNAPFAAQFKQFGTLIEYQKGKIVAFHQPKASLYNPNEGDMIGIVDQKIDPQSRTGFIITQLASRYIEYVNLDNPHQNFLISLDGDIKGKAISQLVISQRNQEEFLHVSDGQDLYEAPISRDLKRVGPFRKISVVTSTAYLPAAPK